MLKNDTLYRRKKVALSLCTVSVITVVVLSVLGVYKLSSHAKRSHKGRMLLSLLTNATQPPNSTSDHRAELLWDRFLEQVRGALYSTATDGWSRSSTASNSEARIPLSSETSASSRTSSRSAEIISFEAEDTTLVDYGKIDDHVVLDAGARSSANDSRVPPKRRRDDLNWMRGGHADGYASFLNYDDDVDSNLGLRKAANDPNEAAKHLNDTSSIRPAAGTGHVYAAYSDGAHKAMSETKYVSVARKDDEHVLVYKLHGIECE
ncbi:hypothetical protein MTO96_002986 [Rhipicephalus appendiculatus]